MPPDHARCDVLHEGTRLARLNLHRGKGLLRGPSTELSGEVEFLLPVEGDPIAAFAHPHPEFLGFDDYSALHVTGASEVGPFEMRCSPRLVLSTVRSTDGSQWALLSSLNEPMMVSYPPSGEPRSVRVLINNFDYEVGDRGQDGSTDDVSRRRRVLTVTAGGRRVTFRWRDDREEILPLLRSGLLRCSSLPKPVESPYKGSVVVRDSHIHRVFAECFENHRLMMQSLLWRKLHSYCGTVDDPPTLEQRFASLMVALEFLMRNALADSAKSVGSVDKMDLSDLIGDVKSKLGWNIPKHYTSGERWRRLRNATMHGNERPAAMTKDNTEFLEVHNKLRLFLFRRALMHLGYNGRVRSPSNGVWGGSNVGDFSDEHNTFHYDRT